MKNVKNVQHRIALTARVISAHFAFQPTILMEVVVVNVLTIVVFVSMKKPVKIVIKATI